MVGHRLLGLKLRRCMAMFDLVSFLTERDVPRSCLGHFTSASYDIPTSYHCTSLIVVRRGCFSLFFALLVARGSYQY